MAVTDIQATVLKLTGATPAANTIEDAQRSIVSSVPKNLLKFAMTASSASTDGSAISFTINDSIIDVQRNGYSCTEIPFSQSKWALDSSSLHKATDKHPVYWHQNDGVKIAPVTSSSSGAGYVFYVNSGDIDDDSDLRTSVIYITASIEFTRLATAELPTWSDESVPVPPASPSFTYTDASVDDIVQPIVSIIDKSSLDASAPTYIAPVVSPDFADANTWINTEEDSEMVSSRVAVISAQITEFQAKSADSLNTFNEENIQYQEDITRKTENLQKDIQEAIQNATNDLQVKSTNINKDVQIELQNAMQGLQKDVQEYASKVQLYQAELSKYGSVVNVQVQEFQSRTVKANFYSQQAEKYYTWGKQEVLNYVQYNSKMVQQGAAIAAQQGEK